MRRPRGIVVLAGPDGAGKTTVLDELRSRAEADDVPFASAHSRPGLLFGRVGDGSPVTDPHNEPPRGTLSSFAKLGLVFLDHVLGTFVRWRRAARDGLVVVERGWYDMAVDPRRYRLPQYFARVVQALGWLLPRADVLILLGGDPAVVHARKPEVEEDEVARQLSTWRRCAPRAAHEVVEVDTVGVSASASAEQAWRAIERSSTQVWRKVPLSAPRLSLRVTGTPSALAVYRPLSRKARTASRLHGSLVTAKLAPRAQAPIEGLPDLLRELGIDPEGVASFRSSAPGRWVLGVADGRGLRFVLKVGPLDDEGLRREVTMLERLGRARLPFGLPHLCFSGEMGERFVLLTDAVSAPDRRPSSASTEIACQIATSLVRGPDGVGPLTHGDLAPWNLLVGLSGTIVIDWEESRTGSEPLFDLAHYVIQAGALLKWHSPSTAATLLTATHSPGWRHLEALGCDPTIAPKLVVSYLESTDTTEPAALRYRQAVLDGLS